MTGRGWTVDDAPLLNGRRAVVTGASGGLGYEIALGLARQNAIVVLAGRDPGKAEAARRRILNVAPCADIRVARLDLADLSVVKSCADGLMADGEAIDILVNNAGVMAFPTRRTTRDGFEEQFGTNYLGHFALTARLMPALLRAKQTQRTSIDARPGKRHGIAAFLARVHAGARIVSIASLAHAKGHLALNDLQGERRYDPWAAYRQSKLALLIFARELQRRADAAGWPLRSVAAHPGWAVTDIIRNGPGQGQGGLKPALMRLAFDALAQSAADGALPILYAATAYEATPGGYYGPTGRGERTGPVGPARVMPQAADAATARALWDASERLTGVRFEEVTA